MTGSAPHIPVLLSEVLDVLQPIDGATMLDGTFGAGGYTKALLDAGARVIAVDRDPTAIAGGHTLEAAYPGRLDLVEGRFGALDEHADAIAGSAGLDGVVLDIGVSSMQLDLPERGFSFRADGPLDMRMARSGPSAAELVNSLSQRDLAQLIYVYGEDRRSRRIAAAICERRTETPFSRTGDLAALIEKTVGRRPDERIHPATRTFQALRIAVNDELGELFAALAAAERALKPGGRLAVVTFHSLEDRIVKRFFAERSGHRATASRHMPAAVREAPTFELVNRKPIEAGEAETAANPRARSARLRAGRRLDADPRPLNSRALGVPDLGFDLPGER